MWHLHIFSFFAMLLSLWQMLWWLASSTFPFLLPMLLWLENVMCYYFYHLQFNSLCSFAPTVSLVSLMLPIFTIFALHFILVSFNSSINSFEKVHSPNRFAGGRNCKNGIYLRKIKYSFPFTFKRQNNKNSVTVTDIIIIFIFLTDDYIFYMTVCLKKSDS